ncbi:hypothetical protein N2152v2_000247 [Parachlorella kessleri]
MVVASATPGGESLRERLNSLRQAPPSDSYPTDAPPDGESPTWGTGGLDRLRSSSENLRMLLERRAQRQQRLMAAGGGPTAAAAAAAPPPLPAAPAAAPLPPQAQPGMERSPPPQQPAAQQPPAQPAAPYAAQQAAPPAASVPPAAPPAGMQPLTPSAAVSSMLAPALQRPPGGGELDGMGGARRTSKVRFWLKYRAEWGQRLKVVGTHESLGGWVLTGAPELKWSEGDNWHATVELPTGCIVEYKYVLLDHSGQHAIAWQRGNNSVLAVRQSDDFVEVFDNWGGDPGAKVVSDGGPPATREGRLLSWAGEIEAQVATQRVELRRARMELVAAQEDAQLARQDAQRYRTALARTEQEKLEAMAKARELEVANQVLQAQLEDVTVSFRQALETAADLLQNTDEALSSTSALASGLPGGGSSSDGQGRDRGDDHSDRGGGGGSGAGSLGGRSGGGSRGDGGAGGPAAVSAAAAPSGGEAGVRSGARGLGSGLAGAPVNGSGAAPRLAAARGGGHQRAAGAAVQKGSTQGVSDFRASAMPSTHSARGGPAGSPAVALNKGHNGSRSSGSRGLPGCEPQDRQRLRHLREMGRDGKSGSWGTA